MATFTYEASYGAQRTTRPRALSARFGDGYEQRTGDGINTQPAVWDLQFSERGTTDADAIDAFLVARAGTEAFDWTPPGGSAGRYICREWRREVTGPARYRITASFEQVYEP